jgi:DNA polymerase
MVMPTFHPAALLRDPQKKKPVWEDIKQVREKHLADTLKSKNNLPNQEEI